MRYVYAIAIALLVLLVAFFPLVGKADGIPAGATRYRAELTRQAHAQWGLDAPIASLAAQVHQESGWNPQAVNRVGATGMAQFMPSTAAWWCSSQALADCTPSNPTWALRALVGYDKYLFDRVQAKDACNRLAFTLSAYNGGLGWVNRDKALASSKGLDSQVWWESVYRVNAGRSPAAWKENRDYTGKIVFLLTPRYSRGGWGEEVCRS